MMSTLFERALAEISQGVLIAGPDRKMIYANGAFVAITGFHCSDVIGKTCGFLQGPDTDPATIQEIRNALATGRAFAGKILNYRKSGEPFWNDLAITPVHADDGAVTGYIGVTRDMTELVNAQAARRSMEDQHHLMFNNVRAGIVLHDASGALLYANPLAFELLGVQFDEVNGALLSDPRWTFVRGDGSAMPIEEFPVSLALSTRQMTSNLVIGIKNPAVDRITWVMGNAIPVLNDAGELVMVVVSFTDVTDLKEAEQALALATKKAEAATEAKSQFLANMSHEIRTPLTGVLGYASVLSELVDLPVEALALVDRIKASGEILLATVNDVLDLSRLEAGQLNFAFLPANVVEVISDTLRLFEMNLSQKKLTLDFVITSQPPEIVNIDVNRLRQILVNLIANAIKFTPEGGITVSVGFDPIGAMLQFEVMDTGIGIEPDIVPSLFHRFSQADVSTTRKFGGSGLGLAICKYLVERMGGRIGVESTLGSGSRFWFEVPTRDDLSDIASEPSVTSDRPLSLAGARILVIDDNATVRDLASRILEALGLEVETAIDGFDGLARARLREFDLFLIDRQMPGLCGEEVARQLRTLPGPNRNKPLIAFSADVISDLPQVFDGSVGKPIDVKQLALELSQHLARDRSAFDDSRAAH